MRISVLVFMTIFASPCSKVATKCAKPGSSDRSELDVDIVDQAEALSLVFTPNSVHRAEPIHVVRLGAVLLSLHVAVGPSKTRRADTAELLLSLAGKRAPVYLLYTTCRSLNGHAVPALSASFLASFEALGERKSASNA